MTQQLNTNTSRWSLVVLRATETRATLWVGTLFSDMKKPAKAYVELEKPDGSTVRRHIAKKHWQRPFRDMRKRFYVTVEFDALQPGEHYRVSFVRQTETVHRAVEEWQTLRRGQFHTLPAELPASDEVPFTIGFGSCFYSHRDGGQAAGSYRALYERGPEAVRPRMTFLTGDQVYLDIGFDSLSFVDSEIRQRVADDYASHWQMLGSILNRGATWMLPDDHEYWNDYPFHDSLLPTLLALKWKGVRETWERASRDGVRRVQQCPRVDSFKLGELSFCLADLRSYRSENGFLPEKDFQQLTSWGRGLTGPGVLVIPQPLIVKKSKTERNLLSFKAQYAALLEALGASGHDVVVISGDVHFGRIATATLGPNGGKLVELVSSPLSNLTGLNGIATSTPDTEAGPFPPPGVTVPGWDATPDWRAGKTVSVRQGWLFSAYPKDRTSEHFMTAGFRRAAGGHGVEMQVNAWKVRERDSANLPKRDFQTVTMELR